jgi:hypothetical protein
VMKKCREVATDVAAGRVESAIWTGRLSYWMHFLLCPHCRRYRDQISELGQTARGLEQESSGAVADGTLESLERAILGDAEE